MPEAVAVHVVTEARPDFRWQLDIPAPQDLSALVDQFSDLEPLVITTEAPLDEQPTFSMIDGFKGAFVAKLDENLTPGVGFFAYFQTDVVPLGGDADGSVLVLPITAMTVEGANLDPSDATTWPFQHNKIDSGFFRVAPFEDVVLCGQWILKPSERIHDIERNSEMEFPDWLELAGATGLTLTEVWRHNFEDGRRPYEEPSFTLPPPSI